MESAKHFQDLESAESVVALQHGQSILNTFDLKLTRF